MLELEFLGRGADGESLVFSDSDGNRFTVPLTEDLRTSVRHSQTKISVAKTPTRNLSPGIIQTMLRQGFTVEEIASSHGLDPAKIRRYEGPVEAEKQWAVRQALAKPIGNEVDSPTLEELVVNRLAARGVDPTTLSWTAMKRDGHTWEIQLTFVLGALERSAHWQMGADTRARALDQEAIWLTESTSTAFMLPDSPLAAGGSLPLDEQEALLDELNSQRGRPQTVLTVLEDIDGEELAFADEAAEPAPTTGSSRIPAYAAITDMLTRRSKSQSTAWEPQEVEPTTPTDLFAGIDEAVSLTPLPHLEVHGAGAEDSDSNDASEADADTTRKTHEGAGSAKSNTHTASLFAFPNLAGKSSRSDIDEKLAESDTGELRTLETVRGDFEPSASGTGALSAIILDSADILGEETDRDDSPRPGTFHALSALREAQETSSAQSSSKSGGGSSKDRTASFLLGGGSSTSTKSAKGSTQTSGSKSEPTEAGRVRPNLAATGNANDPDAILAGSARVKTSSKSAQSQKSRGSTKNSANSKADANGSSSGKPQRRSVKKRVPMPSWDEIVFGSKHE